MLSVDLQSSLRAKFNPDGSELRKMQERLFEMLYYFDEFCKKNNIVYWLSSGTCLGAYRHHGFIPWDDDLDIEMPLDEYKKLCSLSDKFNNGTYVIQNFKSDPDYITPWAKIRDRYSHIKEINNRDKFFEFQGLFIDIFVLDANNSFLSKRISHILQYTSYLLTDIKNNKVRRFLKWAIYGGMHNIVFPIWNFCDSILVKKGNYGYPLGYGYYNSFPSECFFPLTYLPFEGKEFPCPGNVKKYLTSLYGDYEKLPDLNEIRTHNSKVSIW